MATAYETLESQVGVLAAPIAAYVAAILAEQTETPDPEPIDPEPEPEPTDPEPEPEPETPVETPPTLPTTADTDTVFQIVDYTAGDYAHGINVKDNAVLLRPSTAVKAGLKLRFKNSQGSIIASITPVTISGVELAKVVVGAITLTEALGAPGSVTLYGMTTTPTPTPEPTPETFVRRKKGKVAVNGAVGAGADHIIPGIESTHYTMLKSSEMDRIKSYGITDIRVGYLEGRIFPEAANPLKYWQGNDVTQPSWGRVMTLDHLIRIGEQAADRGMTIMLDNHSYGYFPSNGAPNRALLGSAGNTVDMWVERQYQFLKLLKANAKAWSAFKRFDVMNEPYMAEHDAKFLAGAYQKLLDRCGPLTGTDLIYVFEGPAYSSMSRWAELVGDAFDNLTHPNGRAYIEFSAHGYLDRGKDGYFDENKDGIINEADQLLATGETWETLAVGRAKGFVEWAIRKNFNVSVGESIVPGNLPLFLKAFDDLLTYLLDNGVTVYVFAVGDSIDKGSEHNLETTNALSGGKVDNTNTLALVKAKAKIYNV